MMSEHKNNQAKHTLIALFLILAILFSVACAPANEAVLAATPELKATLAPTPTPIPELTNEQKKALLGIDEDFEPCAIGSIVVFELSFGNVTGRIWGITYRRNEDASKIDFHSVCNDEYLFTIDLDKGATFISDYPDYLGDSSENLKNLKLINSTTLSNMAKEYASQKISYNDCQEINDIFSRWEKDWDGTKQSLLSKEQIIDLIIKSTPQEKIIPFWVYTPGATIPDELKGTYSVADYPPAPAAAANATPTLSPAPTPVIEDEGPAPLFENEYVRIHFSRFLPDVGVLSLRVENLTDSTIIFDLRSMQQIADYEDNLLIDGAPHLAPPDSSSYISAGESKIYDIMAVIGPDNDGYYSAEVLDANAKTAQITSDFFVYDENYNELSTVTLPQIKLANDAGSPLLHAIPELTLEQKELLLGIGKNSAANTVSRISVFVYTLNGQRYRSWCYSLTNEEKSEKSNGMRVRDMFDLFTGEYLFSVSLPNDDTYKDGQSYSIDMYIYFLSETNPVLNGMKLDYSSGLATIAITYKRHGVNYNDDPTLNNFAQPYIENEDKPFADMDYSKIKQVSNTVLSVEMQIQIFLNSTPQDEIMPYWVFTPGATIPEELKAFYSEADYPPAPAE